MNRRWYYLGVALLLASILFRQSLLLVTGLLVMVILATTDIWEKYCLRNLHYQREFSEQRVLFGEEITFSLLVENAKILPLPWLEIVDTIPRSLTITGQHLRINLLGDTSYVDNLFSMRWYERVTRRYTIRCNARGVHKFGPATVRSGDVFGFLSRDEMYSNLHYLLVYPLVIPLTSFGLPARYPFGDRRAPRRLLEDPSRVIGVREYAYGDSLRRVHWKATARTMQMQSKVYEATTTYTLVTFLNVAAKFDTHFGLQPELQELAICAAASVADWALNEGYAVGLYANTLMFVPEEGMPPPPTEQAGEEGQEQNKSAHHIDLADQLRRRRIHVPPASNEEQRKRIMEALSRIQPYFGISIEEVIHTERSRLPAGATVIVITSTITDMLLDTLARVKQAGHAVILLFVGETSLPTRLAGVTVYSLGGAETWKNLAATYSTGVDESSGTMQAGFRL